MRSYSALQRGTAYRLETSLTQSQVKVYREEASFNFAGNYTVYFRREETFFSQQ